MVQVFLVFKVNRKHLCVILLYLACTSTGAKESFWRASNRLKGLQVSSNIIFSVKVRSRLECMVLCQADKTCWTASYDKRSNVCSGYTDEAIDMKGILATDAELKIYSPLHKDCRDFGWEWIRSIDLCVLHIRSPGRSHAGARSDCQSRNADLIQLQTKAKYDYVFNFIHKYWSDCASVILGGTRVSNTYKWFDGTEIESARYCPFEPYPDPPSTCIAFICPNQAWCSSDSERLDNVPCNGVQPYICALDTA